MPAHKMFILASFLAASTTVFAQSPERALYEAGTEQFHAGDYRAATVSFEKAISLAPVPEADTSYLPWLYLAASEFQQGKNCSGSLAFAQSRAYGDAANVPYGQTLIAHYQAHLADTGGPDLADLQDPAVGRVLQRCRLIADVEDTPYPWYFHYLLGMEHESAGQAREALNAYLMGANLLQEPERGKRAYGMHFVDYLPYYRIARSHAELGDWPSAREALDLSRRMGEFAPGDPDFDAFNALESQVAARLSSGL